MKLSNLCLYRLIEPLGKSAEVFAERLAEHRWRPCGPLDAQVLGWHQPAPGVHEELVHAAEGRILISARREAKMLPASVLRDHMNDALAEFESKNDRKMGKSERESLRERITDELLPRAFSRHTDIQVLIDDRSGWLLVDTASATRAEEVIGLLRDSLGSLRIRPPEPRFDPIEFMTRWLQHPLDLPRGFALGEECEFVDPRANSTVRLRRHALTCDEIDAHLKAGKRVTRLGVAWQEKASFTLGDDFIVRKLQFADRLSAGESDDDPATRFDADFALFSHTAVGLCDGILHALGGEVSASKKGQHSPSADTATASA